MSYVQPLVEVYNQYSSPTAVSVAPLLSCVVIGPQFHLRSYALHKDLVGVGSYDAINGSTFLLPDAKAGMLPEATGHKVILDDVMVSLIDAADGEYDSSDLDLSDVVESPGSDFVTDSVAQGDTVLIKRGSDDELPFLVVEVLDGTHLRLNKNLGFSGDESGLGLKVQRRMDDQELSDSYVTIDVEAKSITVALAAQLSVDSVARDVVSAVMYCEYKALDVSNAFTPVEISSEDDIQDNLGLRDGDKNPLATGAFVAYGNAQKRIYALGLETNDSSGWAKARDIANKRGIYAKALLTDDTLIISLFKALEVVNRQPLISKYGISIGTHKVADLEILEVATGTSAESIDDVVSGKRIIFQDNTADFVEDDIQPGDLLTITSGVLAANSPYIVDDIVNANKLKVVASNEFTSAVQSLEYKIERLLSESQLAERIAAVSASFGHKGVVMTFPDLVRIDGEVLPGYYATCIVGGMIAGLPPHAGLTFKGVVAVDRVYNSNFKFEDADLDVIAGGGTLILVQDDEASLPYIRHQLTTDMTLLETSELSAVRNADYVSIFFKAIIQKFLGKWNVQEGLFIALRPAIEKGIAELGVSVSPELGAILLEAEIIELKQSEVSKDRIEIVLDTKQPAPFNRGVLTIIV